MTVRRQDAETIVTLDGEEIAFERIELGDGEARFCDRRRRFSRDFRARRRRSLGRRRGSCRRFVDRTYAPPRLKDADADGAVRAPVSGVVVAVEAGAGDAVRRGQVLATMESMKMHYAILAPIDGVIAEAHAVAGRQAAARALLFAIAPEGG